MKKAKSYDKYLDEYSLTFSNLYYNYSSIQLSMLYYTVFEMLNEEGGYDYIRPLITEFNDALYLKDDERLKTVKVLRAKVMDIMNNITIYTDILSIYEYILNRVEYRFKDNNEVDIDYFLTRIEQFIFGAKEDAVITNDKIKSIISELPVRMTKQRFYDIISDSIMIYKDSDEAALKDFIYMIITSAGLNKDFKDVEIKGIEGIDEFIEALSSNDYKDVSKDQFNDLTVLLDEWSSKLGRIVGIYMVFAECINNYYVIAELEKYTSEQSASTKHALNMLFDIRDNFNEEPSEVLERCVEYLEVLEGRQEDLMERLMGYEGMLSDVSSKFESDERIKALNVSMKLVSTSIFINLEEDSVSPMVTKEFVDEEIAKTLKAFEDFFKEHSKIVNRAVMSKVFNVIPVFFNSVDEIKDYFKYSVEHCKDDSELAAALDIVDSIMDER